jgi:hypothetical protein
VVDKVALRQVFSEYFGFRYKFSFHRLFHTHHHLSFGAGTIGQLVADVPSALSLSPSQKTKKKITNVLPEGSGRERMTKIEEPYASYYNGLLDDPKQTIYNSGATLKYRTPILTTFIVSTVLLFGEN